SGDIQARDYSASPVSVLDETGAPLAATAIACSGVHACALVSGGGVACWGGSVAGDGAVSGDPTLGNPMRARAAPMLGAGFVGITGGDTHFCATRDTIGPDGVVCWGESQGGEMGLGNDAATMREGVFSAGDAWARGHIAVGSSVTCMTRAGVVSCA